MSDSTKPSDLTLNDLDDPVALVDPSGGVLGTNAAFEQWFKLETEVATETGAKAQLAIIFPEFDPEKTKKQIGRYRFSSFQIKRKPDGFKRPIPIEVTLKPYKEQEGLWYLHARDASKVAEKELMLASHSKMIEASNKKISLQKKKIAQLLDNLKQAVFSIDDRYRIIEPVSQFTRELFGEDFVQSNVMESLFAGLDPLSEEYSRLNSALVSTFGSDELQWDLSEEDLPRRVLYSPVAEGESSGTSTDSGFGSRAESNTLILKVNYTPIYDSEGVLNRIMFVVEDLTEQERLNQKVAEEKEKNSRQMQMIAELSDVDKTVLEGFLLTAQKTLDRSLKHLLSKSQASQSLSPDSLKAMFRDLHTLKGNARSLSLSYFAAEIHKTESALNECDKSESSDESWDIFIAHGKIAREVLTEYVGLAQKVLQIEDDYQVYVHEEILRNVLTLDKQLFPTLSGYVKATPTVDQSEQAGVGIAHSLKGQLQSAHGLKGQLQSAHGLKGQLQGTGSDQASTSGIVHELESHLLDLKDAEGEARRAILQRIRESAGHLYQDMTETFLDSPAYRAQFDHVAVEAIEKDLEKFAQSLLVQAVQPALAHQLSTACQSFGWVFAAQEASTLERNISDWHATVDPASSSSQATYDSFLQASLASCKRLEGFCQWVRWLHPNLHLRSRGGPKLGRGVSAHRSKHSDWRTDYFEGGLAELDADKNAIVPLFQHLRRGSWLVDFANQTFFSGEDHTPIKEALQGCLLKLQPGTFERDLEAQGRWQVERSLFAFSLDMTALLRQAMGSGSSEQGGQARGERLPGLKEVTLQNFERIEHILDRVLLDEADHDSLRELKYLLHLYPVGYSFARFRNLVFDLGRSLNKPVDFVLEGAAIELPRPVLDQLQDALIHVLRNAVDHGIESKEERKNLNKTERARVLLRVKDLGEDMQVEVSDDGRGISADKVGRRAVLKSLVSEDELKDMSPEDIRRFILEPGFSTAEKLTQVSGRGIGMDVVMHVANKLSGEVVIESTEGRGTSIILRFPKTAVRAEVLGQAS